MAENTNEQKFKLKKIYIALIILAIILSIIAGVIYNYFNKILEDERIYQGISVEDIDIGGLTKVNALKLVKDKKELEIDGKIMKLQYENFNYEIKLRDLNFQYDYEKAIDQAYKIARTGKPIERLKEIRNLKEKNKQNIKLESTFDETKAETLLADMKKDIDVAMVNAQFNFNGGDIIITDAIQGRYVYVKKLIELINQNVYDLNVIEIPVEPVLPEITRAHLERINGVIGEYTTSFKNSTADRKANIQISSQAISNLGAIYPGEIVSFNRATGPRSTENGYKGAIVIVEDEFVDGIGGGVCQTSTTLYNAALRSDLTIVARAPHTIPITYVPFGQDAAVAYDYLDLQFRNDFDFPIYIHHVYTGDSVTFRVYGDVNVKNYEVKIDSQITDTIGFETETVEDKTLEEGKREVVQEGRTGYKAQTFKTIVKPGETGERKLITNDYYRERKSIVRVGTKVTAPIEESSGSDSE